MESIVIGLIVATAAVFTVMKIRRTFRAAMIRPNAMNIVQPDCCGEGCSGCPRPPTTCNDSTKGA